MRKFAIIINMDDVIYSRPLLRFLTRNAALISHVYLTPFHPPQANAKEYDQIVKSLFTNSYKAKYAISAILKSVGRLPIMPEQVRANCSMRMAARFKGVSSSFVENVNHQSFISTLKKQKITALLSLTSQIYRKDVIDLPDLKIYNFHPGLLPNNKGRFPIFWACLKQEMQGITCHEINEKIDEGKVIYQRYLRQQPNTVENVMMQVLEEMPNFMEESLEHIINNSTKSIDGLLDFYGRSPRKSDIQNYRRIINN